MSDYFLALTDHYKRVRARLNGSPPPLPVALETTEHALIRVLAPEPAPAAAPEPPPPPEPEPEPPPPVDPLPGVMCSLETKRAIVAVLEQHNMSWAQVVGRTNKNPHVFARADVYILLRERGWSFPRIGALVGGRDHTTIINSVQRYNKRKESK